MRVLTGKSALISVLEDSTWIPLLCAMEVRFYYDFEEIKTTSRNSGRAVERETRLLDWGFSVSGLTKIDNTDGQKSFFWLAQASIRGSKQTMRIRYTDGDGNTQDIYGDVLIKQGELSSSISSGFTTGSLSFPGTGSPTIGTATGGTPVNEYKLYLSTTPGAFEVAHVDLAGATQIMLVLREDGGYTEVSGSPTNRQFKYTDLTTSGKLTFDSTLPFNPGEIVYVRFYK